MAFDVSTIFRTVDQITPFFKKAARSSTLFGDRATKAFNKASRAGSGFGKIFKGVTAANIFTRGTAILTRNIGEVVGQFISLDDAIVSAAAKFTDVNLLTAEGQAQMEALRKQARLTGGQVEFTATQAAQGLDFLALAGFNSVQAMSLLPGTVDLATVAQVDLARSTDIASDALGAFGLMTQDTTQLQLNFARQNDVMALTMSRTNTNIEDMFEAIKKGAPIFTQAGQSVETFNALLGIMANSGIKGAESGTQLRNMILRLSDATPKAQKALNKLGVTVADETGAFRDIVDILADMEKGLVGVASAQKLQTLSTIFGTRAITGVSILLDAGVASIRDFRMELLASAGASQAMADIMRSSLGNLLKALKSALIEKAFQIFTRFQDGGTSAIKTITDAVRTFDMEPIIDTVSDLLDATISLGKGLSPLFRIILPVGILAFTALAKILEFLGPALPALAGMLGVLAIDLALATIAQWNLNAAMAANPIGAIIIGITLLVAAGVWLQKNWDDIAVFFIGMWDSIKDAFGEAMKFVIRMVSGQIRFVLNLINSVAGLIGIKSSVVTQALIALDVLERKASGIFDKDRTFRGLRSIGAGESAVETGRIAASRIRPFAFIPPKQDEIAARQSIDGEVNLNINGLSSGATVDSDSTGSIPFQVNLAGANP